MINSSLNAHCTKIWVTLDNPGGREINKNGKQVFTKQCKQVSKSFWVRVIFFSKFFLNYTLNDSMAGIKFDWNAQNLVCSEKVSL